MQFVDYVKIKVVSGNGGPGCSSFRREKYVPRGGPDGGDGGRGGHVIIQADTRLHTLLDLRYQQLYRAEKGQGGMGKQMHGKDGLDMIIHVPVGTVVKDLQTGEVLADLTGDGQRAMVAKGGLGGRGNVHFKTSVRQAPRYAQPGIPGEERELGVELKLLADVGLVGLPNAGKSTLISAISEAKPKVADYPFTTLKPVLGVVRIEDYKSFVVADIPGLIEGAHEGAGLGFQFLRHVERTKALLHMVDVSVGAQGDPVESFLMIQKELRSYDPALGRKPLIVAATKTDAVDEGRLDTLRVYCETNGMEFHAISAATGAGIKPLVGAMARRIFDAESSG